MGQLNDERVITVLPMLGTRFDARWGWNYEWREREKKKDRMGIYLVSTFIRQIGFRKCAPLAYVTRFGDNAIPDLFARTCDTANPLFRAMLLELVLMTLSHNCTTTGQCVESHNFQSSTHLMNPLPVIKFIGPPFLPETRENLGRRDGEVEIARSMRWAMVSLCCRVVRCIVDYCLYGFMIVSSIFIHCVFVQDEI